MLHVRLLHCSLQVLQDGEVYGGRQNAHSDAPPCQYTNDCPPVFVLVAVTLNTCSCRVPVRLAVAITKQLFSGWQIAILLFVCVCVCARVRACVNMCVFSCVCVGVLLHNASYMTSWMNRWRYLHIYWLSKTTTFCKIAIKTPSFVRLQWALVNLLQIVSFMTSESLVEQC